MPVNEFTFSAKNIVIFYPFIFVPNTFENNQGGVLMTMAKIKKGFHPE